MFCRSCAHQLDDKAVACTQCGLDPRNGTAFCQACGKPTVPAAVVCTNCGVALATPGPTVLKGADKKIPAGVCGILLGALGVHKFILGYTVPGVIMLLVTICTCGWGAIATGVIGLIEGILYLTKSDEEFVRTYVQNQKHWF